MLNKEAYREAKDKQAEVFKWRGTEEMLEAYRRKGPCMTKEAIQYALDHPGPISSPTPTTISKGTLKRCDGALKDNGIIVEVEAYYASKKPPPDSVAEAGEAVARSAEADEQTELRKEHVRQIADQLYSLVDSGGKDRLFAKPWAERYPLLQNRMRPAWEHLQSYPVALKAVGKAVTVWDNHVRLLTEVMRLFGGGPPALLDCDNQSAISVARDILKERDSLLAQGLVSPEAKLVPALPRYEAYLSSWNEVLAAEKETNQAIRDIVVLLRNGAPLEGTCELGY